MQLSAVSCQDTFFTIVLLCVFFNCMRDTLTWSINVSSALLQVSASICKVVALPSVEDIRLGVAKVWV